MSAAANMPRWWILLAGLLVAVVQLAVPGSMIAGRIALLSAADEITLKTVPVDPRDMFRGDYVVLRYAITQVALSDLPYPADIAENDRLLAVIVPNGDDWSVASLSRETPQTVPSGGYVLQARVASVWGAIVSRTARLEFGIESYFVPEGTGKRLEDLVREKALSVIVAVDDQGRSAIKGLVIDGERIYDEPLF